MWLRRILGKLPKWRLPASDRAFRFDPEIEKLKVLTAPVEIASPEIHGGSYQINTNVCHFDLAINHSFASLELISGQETTVLRLIRSRLVGHTRNIQLLNKPRSHGHIFGSGKFGLAGPSYPILYPHLGEAFDNPAAFSRDRAPFDFQITGAKFLVQTQSAILADEMGLGKTVQAIIAMRYLFQSAAIRTALIICPKSILKTWEQRLNEWSRGLVTVAVKNDKIQRRGLWQQPAHVYLASYETVSRDVQKETDFDLLILDEIQKIKNPKTLIHKSVSFISAERKWGLSGTPLENRIDELISIFSFLKPGLLLKKKKRKNPNIIKRRIHPYILRRRKIDVLQDLPPKLHNEVWLELTESQRAEYDEIEQHGLERLNVLGPLITVEHVFALITKLKLICNLNPVTNESVKLDYLKEKLQTEIGRDDKVLVFSQFPQKTLRHIMNDVNIGGLLFDGSLSLRERDKIVDLFQNDDEHRILFISLKSGGYGLNLTRANYVYRSSPFFPVKARRLGITHSLLPSFVFWLLVEQGHQVRVLF